MCPASATASSRRHSTAWWRLQPDAILALAALIVFHASVFGIGAAVQRSRYGLTGFAPHLGVDGRERLANALYAAWVLVDIVASLTQHTSAMDATPRILIGAAGLALAVITIIAGTVARISMGAAWRTSADGTDTGGLVTSGPFAVVRNPVYVSMLALALAVALLVPSVWTGIAFVIAVLGLEVQVRAVEEPHLRIRYDDAYLRYAAITGRFVPLLGRLR